MSNKENVSFTLKTTSIDSSILFSDYFQNTITTSTGIVSNNRCNYTWFNVNIKNILGELYNKYDKFNLTLNTVIMSAQDAITETNYFDNRILYIKMSGLPWLSSYDHNNPTSQVILNTIEIPITQNDGYMINYNNPQIITFLKNSDNVNINIVLHSISLDNFGVYTADELFGHFAFLFSITGVENDNLSITKNRLII